MDIKQQLWGLEESIERIKLGHDQRLGPNF